MKKNEVLNHDFLRERKTGFKDYRDMVPEFRPYLMFANANNYKKKIVNTDRLGFRKVHFKNKFYGLDQLKTLKEIDILLGSSVAFGMGSDSDKTSIQSLMSKGERLCFSLGIRGGNGHQEILSFLKFKNFFPKVKNVFIFSGINDISMACLENNLYYQDYGGFSGSQYHTFNSFIQANSFSNENWVLGKTNLFFIINYLSNRFQFFRIFLKLFSFLKKSSLQKRTQNLRSQNYLKRIKNIRKIFSNDLHTWSMIQKQMKIRIIYILQPTVTWTERKPTNFEKKIIKYERDRIKEYFQKDFTSKKYIKKQKVS